MAIVDSYCASLLIAVFKLTNNQITNMSLDLNKIKSRLEALKNTSAKSTGMWKPQPGKQVVRIVPYSHDPENPFIELYFHYGINNKSYLSPSTFGRPDPIVKFSNDLKATGDQTDWKLGRSFEPKMRTYVPVLVRGQESEGVKFWGMGKTVYQELLAIIADPDYGDITDLKNGRDITVHFKTAQETGKDYPETAILVKPNQSVAFDPTDADLRDKVKNQKKVTELFPEPTYEDLEAAFQAHLNAGNDSGEGDTSTTEDSVESATTKASVKAPIKTPSTEEVADEFADMFSKSS